MGIIEPPRTIRIPHNGCNRTKRAALQEELRTSVLMNSEVILIFGKCTYMAIFFFLELPYTFNNTFTTFEIYFHWLFFRSIYIITVTWFEVSDQVKLTGTDHQIKRDTGRRDWSWDPRLSTRCDPAFRIKLLLYNDIYYIPLPCYQ